MPPAPSYIGGLMAATTDRAVSGLLFMTSAMTTLDAYSTLNSSPWTSENFGADPAKAASCREYVRHAVIVSLGYSIAAGIIADSWYPIIGSVVSNTYLVWLYERALRRGAVSGSSGWAM